MTATSAPISIAIIEDNRYIRQGWKMTLHDTADFMLVVSCQSFEEAFACENIDRAGIVMVDLSLKTISGTEGIRILRQLYPDQKHIICSAHEDDQHIFDAIRAGAVGFMAKKATPAEFIRILRDTVEGNSPMTPVVAVKIKSLAMSSSPAKNGTIPEFTALEKAVLENIANGKSYQSIAGEQLISVKDVTTSIRSIYEKIHRRKTSIA